MIVLAGGDHGMPKMTWEVGRRSTGRVVVVLVLLPDGWRHSFGFFYSDKSRTFGFHLERFS